MHLVWKPVIALDTRTRSRSRLPFLALRRDDRRIPRLIISHFIIVRHIQLYNPIGQRHGVAVIDLNGWRRQFGIVERTRGYVHKISADILEGQRRAAVFAKPAQA